MQLIHNIHQIRAQEQVKDQAQTHGQDQEVDLALDLALDLLQVFLLAVLEKARKKERKDRKGKQEEGKVKWSEKCASRKISSSKRFMMIWKSTLHSEK